MILAILLPLIPVAYLAGWLLTARKLFRRYRLVEAPKRLCRRKPGHKYDCKACRSANHWWQDPGTKCADTLYTDGELSFLAFGHAAAWPLVYSGMAIHAFITHDPPLSQAEKDAQIKELAAENERLSKEIDRLHGS